MLKAKIQKKNNILEAAKKIEEGVDTSLDKLIDFIFMRSQELVSKDEGTLQKSAEPIIRDHMRKEIVYRALHAKFVEYGRDPSEKMVPVDVIERWVIRKGIARKGKESHSIAFAIAKHIQKRGTEPHPYLRPAVNESLVRCKEFIKDSVNVKISEIR